MSVKDQEKSFCTHQSDCELSLWSLSCRSSKIDTGRQGLSLGQPHGSPLRLSSFHISQNTLSIETSSTAYESSWMGLSYAFNIIAYLVFVAEPELLTAVPLAGGRENKTFAGDEPGGICPLAESSKNHWKSSTFIALGTPAGPRATRPATCRL